MDSEDSACIPLSSDWGMRAKGSSALEKSGAVLPSRAAAGGPRPIHPGLL